MQIQEGGGLYSFCPGKVTWDYEAANLFEVMTVAVEQKKLLTSGGISDQPGWFITLLAWFGPAYDTLKFAARAKMILGDGTASDKIQGNKPAGQRK